MRAFVQILLALGNITERNVWRREHLLKLYAGDFFDCEGVGVCMNRSTHEQISKDLAGCRLATVS